MYVIFVGDIELFIVIIIHIYNSGRAQIAPK